MIVGSAVKKSDDYGVDPVTAYGGEDGYRTTAPDYLDAKTTKYRQQGESGFAAKQRALNKEGGRFDTTISMNHPLTGALFNYKTGDSTARIVIRMVTSPNQNHFARLVVSSKAKHITVVDQDKKVFVINKECESTMAIPTRAYIEIISSNAGGTGMRGKTIYYYTLDQELSKIKGEGGYVFKIPLFDPKDATVIIQKRMPVTELLLNTLLKQGQVFLRGISFKTYVDPDAHELLFTSRAQPLNDAVFDPSSTAVPKRVRVDDSAYQAVNKLVSKLSGDARYSWTLSHGEEILSSRHGTERWQIGHIGETLLALAFLRVVCPENGSMSVEEALRSHELMTQLMIEAGNSEVVEALRVLYRDAKSIPTPLALLTHTAGLPHEGSLDAECAPGLLHRLLPCEQDCSGIEGRSHRSIFAHILAHRVTLLSDIDCKVVHSKLGPSILSYCFVDLAGTIKALCRELSMVGTSLKDAVIGDQCVPGDVTHRISHLMESSTNDLCQFVIAAERSRVDNSVHRLIRQCFAVKYLIKDHGSGGLQGVTMGGMETMTIRLKDIDGKKRSHVVIYKIGERADRSTALVCYLPGMHLGFACAFDSVVDTLFRRRNHKIMGYGKSAEHKIYSLKHFFKSIFINLPVGLVNTAAELAYSITPRYPAGSSAYKSDLDKLLPSPSESQYPKWSSLMCTSPLFEGAGIAFYPAALVVSALGAAVEAGAETVDSVLGALSPIRIHRVDNRFYVKDHGLGTSLPLIFDPNISCRMGSACAAQHSLHCGAFRVMSRAIVDEVGGILSIHPYKDSPKDSICVYYRGTAFISEPVTKVLFEQGKTLSYERVAASVNESRKQQDLNLRPWLAVDKEEPIGVSFGGALAAGALGGLAGATLANAAYGPRRYYYGPRVYPPPPYPYGYPYGYPYTV